MAKYIDAEKLKAEIERRIKSVESCPFIEAEFGAEMRREGKIQTYNEILSFIDSLPEEPDKSLEEEIDNVIADYSFVKTIDFGGFKTTVLDYAKIARHFFELGQKEMRKRLSNPEYNKEVIEKMKSEYPDSKEENK